MNNEIWKIIPISGFEDYEVSNLGRVRSWKGKSGRHCKNRKATSPKLMRPILKTDNDYYVINFTINGKHKLRYLHQIILETFIGFRPGEGYDACHNDGDKSNNRLDNLRWDTKKNNNADKILHGTHTVGVRHGRHKLTEEKVKELRRLIREEKYTTKMCSKIFGISQAHASCINRGDSWSHV